MRQMVGVPAAERDPVTGRLMWRDPETGVFLPFIGGGAEEFGGLLGSLAISWAAVGSTPVVGGSASGLGRLQVPAKTKLKSMMLRLSGSWDQSVGAETQATEGNPVLIQEVRLNLDGKVRRFFSGAGLYELNRIVNRGAGPKTDPGTGIASGKAFSSTLILDMGFLDADGDIAAGIPRKYRESTYLDLSLYTNVFFEVVVNPFSAYVSGNTQANMAATLTVHTNEITGAPLITPQTHFEALLVNSIDMNVTGSDRRQPLNREGYITRGLLLRVGALNATPKTTAITALTNVGVVAKPKSGGRVVIKEKQAVGAYQSEVGVGRAGITLTAGYLYIELADNQKRSSHLVGNAYDQLDLLFDSAAQAGHVMEVYQLVKGR